MNLVDKEEPLLGSQSISYIKRCPCISRGFYEMQAQERVIQANLDLRNEKDIPKNSGKLRKKRIPFDLAI